MSPATGLEPERESEEAYQLRQRQSGDENRKYDKRANTRFMQFIRWVFVAFASLLIWSCLYFYTRREYSDSLLIGIPKRHRRTWSPGRDWFPTDPYTLPASYYEQFTNRTEVLQHCPLGSHNFSQLANVVAIDSAFHNGLYWMGGTGNTKPSSMRL